MCSHYARLYGICKDLQCLPKTGGLDDQDWITVAAFEVVGAEMSAVKSKILSERE